MESDSPVSSAAQFRVHPDGYGDSVTLEHIGCGPVHEWTGQATLDAVDAKAEEHMREVHGVSSDTAGQTDGVVKRPPTDDELRRLGLILARFCEPEEGTAYWGEDSRPYVDGQEGGMTIDTSIVVTREELALLRSLFES